MTQPSDSEKPIVVTSAAAECPLIGPSVEFIGPARDAAYAQRQWLIRCDERFIQLTELLYRAAEQMNGERTPDQIAHELTDATEWALSGEQVRYIVRTKLAPLGIIASPDGQSPARAERARSPLQIRAQRRVIEGRLLEPILRPLALLFTPAILVPALVLIGIAHAWFYVAHGVSDTIRAALYTPGLLLAVVPLILASGVFHEFGHAAALHYGGGHTRGIGVGFYLVYPVFYTDVTDSYRLGRWARVRTDLGGFYFHLLFALGLIALYLLTGQEFLLGIVLVINLDIAFQCMPWSRLDGYWALADLAGIPDLFSSMVRFVRGFLPRHRIQGERLPPLQPWIRRVFLAYLVLVLPVLSWVLLQMVTTLPLAVGIAWSSAVDASAAWSTARTAGDVSGMLFSAARLLVIAIPILASLYFVYGLLLVPARFLWRWSGHDVTRRAVAGLAAAGTLTVIGALSAPYLPFAQSAVPDGVESFSVAQRNHVQGSVTYAQDPPVGGDHAPIWQNCGFYAAPIASEFGVHSLEHGAVWITYRPDLPADEVQLLRETTRSDDHVLVTPYPDLPSPLVASAWGKQMQLQSADDPRLDEFLRAFRGGPQAPERGGPCTGGIGTPN